MTTTHNGELVDIGSWEVKKGFCMKLPAGTKYRVTYTLDPAGKFTVEGKTYPWIKPPGTKYDGRLCVCFLPLEWEGQRVSRKVRWIK